MKKILYVMTSLSHKRVFETFDPRNDVEQMIVGPMPDLSSYFEGLHTVPEDYKQRGL